MIRTTTRSLLKIPQMDLGYNKRKLDTWRKNEDSHQREIEHAEKLNGIFTSYKRVE